MALAEEGPSAGMVSAVALPRRGYASALMTVALASGISALTLGWMWLLARATVWLVWG